jgi:hypothetical protein
MKVVDVKQMKTRAHNTVIQSLRMGAGREVEVEFRKTGAADIEASPELGIRALQAPPPRSNTCAKPGFYLSST